MKKPLLQQIKSLTVTQVILGLCLVLIVLQFVFIQGLQRQILTQNTSVLAYIATRKGERDAIQTRNEIFDGAIEARLTAALRRIERLEQSSAAESVPPGGRSGR